MRKGRWRKPWKCSSTQRKRSEWDGTVQPFVLWLPGSLLPWAPHFPLPPQVLLQPHGGPDLYCSVTIRTPGGGRLLLHSSPPFFSTFCSTMFTHPPHRESLHRALTLSPALEENHGELGICLHQSPSGGNEEPGEVEQHEIQAGSICQDSSACRIAVTPLLRAVAVGGHLGLSVRERFIY